MQGGVNQTSKWNGIQICYGIEKEAPSIALDCFSPIEIEGIADVTGLSTFEVYLN